MKKIAIKKGLLAIFVLLLLLTAFPLQALAAESYTDVSLNFRDASNGYIFMVSRPLL